MTNIWLTLKYFRNVTIPSQEKKMQNRKTGKATDPEIIATWDKKKLVDELFKQARTDFGGVNGKQSISKKWAEFKIAHPELPPDDATVEFAHSLCGKVGQQIRNRHKTKREEILKRLPR